MRKTRNMSGRLSWTPFVSRKVIWPGPLGSLSSRSLSKFGSQLRRIFSGKALNLIRIVGTSDVPSQLAKQGVQERAAQEAGSASPSSQAKQPTFPRLINR